MSNQSVVENVMLKNTSESFFYQEQGNFIQLRQNASFFLEKINYFQKKKINQSLRQWGSELASKMSDSTDISEIMSALSVFQTQVNLFLGRTIYLTYICSDGNIRLFDDFQAHRIYTNMQPSKDSRGNMKVKNNLGNFTSDMELSLNLKIQASLKNKQRVYTQALRRFQKKPRESYKRDKFKGMQYKNKPQDKNTFYFYLWDQNHIHWSRKTSRGAIGQAYVWAVVNEDNSITNADIEWSLLRLGVLTQTKQKVNSIGGIIKGDVELQETNGEIQFAVKSMNLFSSPSIRQYMAFAYNILLFTKLTKKEVQQNIKQLSNIKGNSEKILKNITGWSQKKILERIESVNKKIIISIF